MRMVISEIPPDVAKKIRLECAEYNRSRTDLLVIALRMVLGSPELLAELRRLLGGSAS